MSANKTARPKSGIQYRIELPVVYDSQRGGVVKGRGRTLAMTARTVRFASDTKFRVGLPIRLSILWPVRLQDGTALNLWMFGRIEQSAFGEVEVAISRHEFRTRSLSAAARAAA